MLNEIIELLPSPDLKEKIKETNHQFKDNELLQIIYKYAPTFDLRLKLLSKFAQIASSDVSALAKVYIEYEQEKLKRFIEASDGFIYELHIKETPESYDESYICSSYNASLVCIDCFFEEYDAKETEQTRYRIIKRKIFSECKTFEEDIYAECVLGANKTILEVSDYHNPRECENETLCSECTEICHRRCDTILFPNFVNDQDIIKYYHYEGKPTFGVCLYTEDLAEDLYVIPLNSTTIRDHLFKDDSDYYDHCHIELPLAKLTTPDELDEVMRKNYFDFIGFLKEKK